MRLRKATTVAAGALIVSVGMLLTRFLGIIRDNLLLHYFGESNVTGAYRLAFMVPDMFYYLLAGGAMSVSFIPVFSSYLAKDEDHEAHLVGSTISTVLLLGMIACVIICMIFAPQLLSLLPYAHQKDFSQDAFNQAVALSRIMCAMLIFTAQSAHLTGILQSFKQFTAPAIASFLYTAAGFFGVVVMSKMGLFGGSSATPSITGVAYSIVLGSILLVAVQFPAALLYGFKFKFLLDFSHPGVRQIFKLFAPMTVSMALSQVNILMVPQIMGSTFGLLAVTDIGNANKLVLLPLGLFAIPLGTAIFPTLSQHAALGEDSAFRALLGKSMKMITLLSIPSAIGLIVLADPICALLYGGGKFGLQGIHASAYVLELFAWSLVGLGLMQVVNRAFYAQHDTRTPAIVTISMVCGNFLLSWVLRSGNFQYGCVAVATTITSTLATLVLIEILRRRMKGFGGRALLTMTVKTLIAALAMGGVVYWLAYLLAPTIGHAHLRPLFYGAPIPVPFSNDTVKLAELGLTMRQRLHLLIQVGFSVMVGMGVYAGLLRLMKVEELKAASDRLLGRFRRRQASAA